MSRDGLRDEIVAAIRHVGAFICSCGCGKPLEDARRQARSEPGYLNPDQAEGAVDGTFVFTGKIEDLIDAVLPVVQADVDAVQRVRELIREEEVRDQDGWPAVSTAALSDALDGTP